MLAFLILLLFSQFTQTKADCACPENFEYLPEFDLCVGAPELSGLGYDANEQVCENFGGMLVKIDDIFYNGFLRALAIQKFTQNSPMIGLHYPATDDTSGYWQWADGSIPSYLHWCSNQPNEGDCAFLRINDGCWYSGSCKATSPYLCQLASTANKCLQGWKYFNLTDSCYYLGHNLSFMDAESYCIIQNGHLTSLHSFDENAFVADLAYDASCSGSFPFKAGTALIGGVFNGTNIKYWTDGTAIDYELYCGNNPDGTDTTTMLRSLPTNCATGCGDGKWMAGYESIKTLTTYPSFVCRAKPLC